MSPTLLSTLTLLFLSYTHNVDASWRMRGSNLMSARIDPLVSPNGVASHVHNVVGGSNFASTYDYDTLRQSSCSSVEVQEDKSNYWAPSLYYKHQDTGKYELVPSGWAVYYLHRSANNEPIVQFPKGFRMIAGTASKTKRNSTDDDAFNYHCLGGGDDTETLELPKRRCDAIRIQVMFQSCWNGVDITSANFKDHVSYPVGTHEGGTCPPSHPKRFMSIFLEQFADTKKFPYYDGAFSLSTGDTVGYSSHADFQNGWDASENSILQQAINTCKDDGANIDACRVFDGLRSEVFNVCTPASKLPVEDVGIYGGLDKIPGDNPPWGGSVPKKTTGVSNKPPYGSAISTLPNGWEYHGCIDEGNPFTKTLVDDTFTDPLMNVALCVDHCDQKGYVLAGLENGNECNCAKELTNGGSMNLVDPWKCNSHCPGNLYEFCGAGRKINLYQKTGAANANNNSPYPPAGSKFTQVFTDGGAPPIVAPVVQNPPTDTTSTSAPQASNPPSPSTSGSNGPMDQNSAAPPTSAPPNAATPSTAATPPTTTPPNAAAPPTTTPAAAATPSTHVCHSQKRLKRVPSFLKRDSMEGFHVPAKHRRMHH